MAPSLILGLTPGSYEAYCLDQATWYLGNYVNNKIDKVGKKKQRGEAGNEAARKRTLSKLLGEKEVKQFADPASFFSE